ncbi:MAG: aspartate kinase [Planctomycetota bacterium]|nr:aspartate kinase [Planctomycetota bacterium]
MNIIVQKFGGSSVADAAKLRRCAERVIAERRAGASVVVVVSAMGKSTDALIALAHEVTDAPSKRELDMLLATGEQVSIALMAMTLESMGCPAVSFTGGQIGMTTDDVFTKAAILEVSADRIRRALREGRVAVVAGFQGVTPDGEITTLGRGGSDTTAVAVAAALGAARCDIFTDVDGVYTADPRLVPTARKLRTISYEAMLEMASLGAKVMHDRSVKFGAMYRVPIHVRHSQKDEQGTVICAEEQQVEKKELTGVALRQNLGRVTLTGVPDSPGVAARIFAGLAEANISVDDIIQTVTSVGGRAGKGEATISFTVDHGDLADIRPLVDAMLDDIGGGAARIDVGFAKVSAVGVGIRSHAETAAVMFRALADAGINIANITTSEIKISAIVEKADGERALRTVHDAFGLGGQPAG